MGDALDKVEWIPFQIMESEGSECLLLRSTQLSDLPCVLRLRSLLVLARCRRNTHIRRHVALILILVANPS